VAAFQFRFICEEDRAFAARPVTVDGGVVSHVPIKTSAYMSLVASCLNSLGENVHPNLEGVITAYLQSRELERSRKEKE
jgi:hypothetical protein